MNKRLIITIILVVVFLALGVFLVLKARGPRSIEPRDNIQEYMNRAEKSIKEGDLLKAKSIYSKIIEEYPDSEFVKSTQEKLEALNMDILFSPVKTEQNIFYVVKEGDTLGKIAKKFHTTVELLIKSNKLSSDIIHPGKRLKVVTTEFSIIVDKSQNTLTLKASDDVLKVYKVSTGAENTTPTGKFKIVNKLVDPVWYKAGAIVPSGSPENILGSRWMGISEPGYGIHGSRDPETIGKHITAGCIRMYNGDIKELYSIVPVGAEVTIVD